jgi:Ca2+-binding RTX toxin-like protein
MGFSPAIGGAIAVDGNIMITFSEAIKLGDGVITIESAFGEAVEIYRAGSPMVTTSGNVLTINPSADLAAGTGYVVEFPAGMIKDLAGNSYAGTTSYNFTTLAQVGQTITGTSGDDTLTGGVGNDTIDGGAGIDTAIFSSGRANYTVTHAGTSYTVKALAGTDGTDTLQNVERLGFSDRKLALDLAPSQHAGQALEFIGALAPTSIGAPSVVGLILGLFDQGSSLHDVCQLALDVGLVSSIAGSRSNQALAAMAFRNLIGSEADAATVDMLVSFMDGRSASYSQADFLTVIAGLDVNQIHIGLVGLQQTGVEYI